MNCRQNKTMWEFFWEGVAGSALAIFAELFAIRKYPVKKLPQWVGSPYYWLTSIAASVVGGGLVLLHIRMGAVMTPQLAVNIGFTLPLASGIVLRGAYDRPEMPSDLE
jgi:hypothetical protein